MYLKTFPLWFDHFLGPWAEICQIFCWFFGKFEISKGHSEINWPLPTMNHLEVWTTAVHRWVDLSNCGLEINDFMTVVKSKWPNFTQSAYVILLRVHVPTCVIYVSRGLLLKNSSCLPRYTETFNLSSLKLLIYQASQFRKNVLPLEKNTYVGKVLFLYELVYRTRAIITRSRL